MRNPNSEKIVNMVMMGLMTCLVIVSTMFIKIPIPMTSGYVHLGGFHFCCKKWTL